MIFHSYVSLPEGNGQLMINQWIVGETGSQARTETGNDGSGSRAQHRGFGRFFAIKSDTLHESNLAMENY